MCLNVLFLKCDGAEISANQFTGNSINLYWLVAGFDSLFFCLLYVFQLYYLW